MTTKQQPAISIVMPVWNAASYLQEALESILNQSFRDFELIAVDDGSTDDSVSIIEAYNDPRIRLIQQGRKGFVTAVNRGVAEARADWIARHDADDISLPDRLELQWKMAINHPKAVFIHCATESFGENLNWTGARKFPRTDAFIALRCCIFCPICVGAALIRKDAFLDALGYREEDFPAEDFAFASRLHRLGSFVGIPKVLYRVRIHESQISQVKRDAQIRQTNRIAVDNTAYYFRVHPDKANTLHSILGEHIDYQGLRHHITLLASITRFRIHSAELWTWVIWTTLIRSLKAIKIILCGRPS